MNKYMSLKGLQGKHKQGYFINTIHAHIKLMGNC